MLNRSASVGILIIVLWVLYLKAFFLQLVVVEEFVYTTKVGVLLVSNRFHDLFFTSALEVNVQLYSLVKELSLQ